MKLAVPAIALALAAATPALADHHALPTKEEIGANFDRWKAALATKNPDTVTALFAANGVLQPTVSNDMRETPAEVKAYFVDFLKLSPVPTINERNIQVLDDNTALEAGIWTFGLTRDGKPESVTARYTFVWEKAGKDWKIQLLHSSKMPEPMTPKP
jgi:uncharacterized protein (TIGR02246 family)